MEFEKDKIYSTQELMSIISQDHPNYKSSSLYMVISKMKEEGIIQRVGRSKYVFNKLNIFSYGLESNTAKKVYRYIKRNYPNDYDFVIYETCPILNLFLNHLIVHNSIIIEVPKIYMEDLFFSLKEAGFKNILFEPSLDDLYRYGRDNSIIIHQLISKAPINRKERKITIEKLIVDILCDSLLNSFYEGAEIPYMIEDIMERYVVKYDTVRTYAKRRHCFDKLEKIK